MRDEESGEERQVFLRVGQDEGREEEVAPVRRSHEAPSEIPEGVSCLGLDGSSQLTLGGGSLRVQAEDTMPEKAEVLLRYAE
jgi:hypothetical protein